ncbi:alpha/beta hydrolase family protein [Pedobacter alpinus]|uniref:Alpha/beta hydrolase family protein n=1 Tax=Pedobacter alpinus TaxID=1590643 RepID=A0ABW5TRX5_9SPHI
MLLEEFSKEDFEIEGADGLPIVGDITYANSYPDFLVIFAHGFKGFKDWGTHQLMANFFVQNGIYFLKFNFSHSGVKPTDLSDINDLETFSLNTPSKELYDLNQILDFAVQKFPKVKIALLGHSRGGALSILQAARDKRVVKLITWAAIGSFRNLWKLEDEKEWKKNGVKYILNGRTKEQMPLSVALLEDVLNHEEEFDLNTAAQSLNKPWLIAQGTKDPAVKVSVAENFHQLQPQSQLLIIEGGDHVFGATHPYQKEELPNHLQEFLQYSVDFIKQ